MGIIATDTVRTPDGVLETIVTDEDVRRVCDEEIVDENTGNPVYSKAVMTLYRKIKRGSGRENDERSRQIVAELRQEQPEKESEQIVIPMNMGQSTLFDFGEQI